MKDTLRILRDIKATLTGRIRGRELLLKMAREREDGQDIQRHSLVIIAYKIILEDIDNMIKVRQ